MSKRIVINQGLKDSLSALGRLFARVLLFPKKSFIAFRLNPGSGTSPINLFCLLKVKGYSSLPHGLAIAVHMLLSLILFIRPAKMLCNILVIEYMHE